jgi:hypothetical protein
MKPNLFNVSPNLQNFQLGRNRKLIENITSKSFSSVVLKKNLVFLYFS